LEAYFEEPITIDKLSNKAVKNCMFSIDSAEQELNGLNEAAQISAYRKGDQLYVSFWR
jgi:hypothetical protein